MAIQEKQAFIKELASSPRRRRPLMLPSRRAILWFALALLISAALMHYVQVFRPGFADQLFHHPFFLIEIVSALLIAPLGAYIVMTRSIPGERAPKSVVLGLWVLVLLFVSGFSAGFTHFAPETSTVGARHACWMEVVAYGFVCLLMFAGMVRRGCVRFSWRLGMLYGLVAGLIPAALMQMACMYNPMHALIFHYLPVVVLVPLGLLAMRIIRR